MSSFGLAAESRGRALQVYAMRRRQIDSRVTAISGHDGCVMLLDWTRTSGAGRTGGGAAASFAVTAADWGEGRIFGRLNGSLGGSWGDC